MSQRTPKICQPRGKIQIPINGEDCLYWLIPVDSVSDIENPTRDFAWITPQGVMYVFDGKKIVPINDPNTLKVQFQNILGSPYDNGELTNALNQKVSNIRMNGQIISQGAGNIVDLGCITTCDDLENAIETLDLLHVEIVDELPENGDEKTAYLVPKEDDHSLYILYFFKENEYREVGTKFVPTEIVKDWDENDPTSVNYIENRTHYVDESGVVHELDPKYIKSALGQLSDGRTSRETVTIDGFSAMDLINRYMVQNADRKSINTAYIKDTSSIVDNVEVVFRGINSENTNYIDIYTTLKNYGSNPITIDVTWAVRVIEYAMIR